MGRSEGVPSLGNARLAIATTVVLSSLTSGAAAEVPAVSALQPVTPRKAKPALICETTSLTPGKTAWLGIHFDIEKKWHIYWNGRNDSGFPLESTITAPPGYTVGDLKWPAPKRHIAEGDILDHIYEGSVTFLFPVEVPADAKGIAEFSAKLSWLVCAEACVAEDADLKLSVPVAPPGAGGSAAVEPPATVKKKFANARAGLPKPLTSSESVGPSPTLEWNGNTVTVKAKSATQIAFFPNSDCAEIENLIKKGVAKGDSLTLQLQADKGVLPLFHGIIEVQYPPTSTGTPATPRGGVAWFEVNHKAGDKGVAPASPKPSH